MKKKILLELLITFMKIGLFTFGGGYAMLSVIESYCVDKKKWITHEDMANITVIAESTPGAISVNCATFVGCRQAGILGAVAATFGVVIPSFAVIYIISVFLDNFREIKIISSAFHGIKAGVGILITDVAIRLIKSSDGGALQRGIFLCSFLILMAADILSLKISSVGLMLVAAIISLSVFLAKNYVKEKGGDTR